MRVLVFPALPVTWNNILICEKSALGPFGCNQTPGTEHSDRIVLTNGYRLTEHRHVLRDLIRRVPCDPIGLGT